MKKDLKRYLITFILGAGFMTLLCILLRITPFGDETFLYDDLRREFIEYYAYLKRVLMGSESLVYSRHKGIGGSMLGLFINYMSSPLNFVYALFPLGLFPTVLTILLIIRMGLAAAHFNVLLSGLGIKHGEAFSLCYSMSMWVFVSLLNPLWLDAAVMFPILLHFALKLLREPGDYRLFLYTSLLTAFQFYLNYYTAVMMMIFIALFAIIRWLLKDISFRDGLTLAGALITGGLLISPVMVPVFLELRLSEKTMSGNILQNLMTGFTVNNPLAILSKLYPFAIDGRQVMFGMPHLYAGAVLLPLLFIYFTGSRTAIKDKTTRGTLFIILILSFTFSPLDLIWQGMNKPSGYPFRYAFLFVALMIVCAAESFDLYFDRKDPLPFRQLAAAFLIPAAVELMLILLSGPLNIAWLPVKWGLLGLFILAGLFGLSCIYLYGQKGFVSQLSLYIIILMTAFELIANQAKIVRASYVPCLTLSDYQAKIAFKSDAIAGVRELGGEDVYYRTEDTVSDPYDSLNDSLVHGYNGVSHYSTGDHRTVRYFLKAIGFNYNGLYDEYKDENTDTADAILSIRYLIENEGIREKDILFPAAVHTTVPVYEELTEDDPFIFQTDMARAFAGDETLPEIFREATVISSDIISDDEQDSVSLKASLSAAIDGHIYFYLADLDNTVQDMSVIVNGELISGYANMSAIKVLDLGYFSQGEVFDLELKVNSYPETADFGRLLVYSEDLEALSDYASYSGKNAIIMEETSPKMLTFDNIQKGYDKLLLSIPYEAGFKACSPDGRQFPVSQAFGALTVIELPEDYEGSVILAYFVPGFKAGCIMLAIGVEILLWLRRRAGRSK
ncbi:YfhO family protein [Butyrivibrio sp. MC2013]|uniref:YfhO family protein n=1 Tax=Butyrivibrio sp. MC2013 TaxID=1280686 RepID=UPI0003FEA8D7|nr:YfhO family protein [Butyrivibrio sp. MC2013]